MKLYKVVPTSSIIAQPVAGQSQTCASVSSHLANASKTPQNATLLQQTLHNQHNTSTASTPLTGAKLSSNLQQSTAQTKPVTSQEHTAKNVLCNW
jgi:hypothetical protein